MPIENQGIETLALQYILGTNDQRVQIFQTDLGGK